MKKILTYMTLCLSMAAVSCTKTVISENEGGMGVLSMDMSISSALTKAMTEEDLLNTASVKIYKADFSGLVRSYTYNKRKDLIYEDRKSK